MNLTRPNSNYFGQETENKKGRESIPWPRIASRTHNAANELTHIDSSASYVGEDAAGNMTAMPKPTSLSSSLTLKYDAWNRLVEVKDGASTVLKN